MAFAEAVARPDARTVIVDSVEVLIIVTASEDDRCPVFAVPDLADDIIGCAAIVYDFTSQVASVRRR